MDRHPNTIAAYHALVESGRLSKVQREVYEALYHHGPMTRNELDAHCAPGRSNAPHSRRLREMADMGVIGVVETVPDPVTGFPSNVYDVTGNEPREVPKRETWRRVLERRIADLEQRVAAMGRVG